MAFNSIKEFREEHPEYNDMTDMQLAKNIHKQWYSDMPFREVAQSLGVISKPTDEVDRTTGLPNFAARTKLSFIDKPAKREKFLKTIYDDVRRLPDGTLVYRHPQTKKLTTIDEEGWSASDIADWADMVPETVAGTIGSILMAPIPVPGARIAGAGVGSMVGHGIRKHIGETIMGEKHDWDVTDEEIKGYLGAGAAGVVGETVGAVIVKGAAPFAKKITPAKKVAKRWFAKYGGKITPAQLTETRILDTLEVVAESSILGGGRFRQFRETQDELITNIAKDMVERFRDGATTEEAGLLVQKLINNKKIAFKKAGNALYGQVDKITEGVTIDIRPLRDIARKKLKELTPTVSITEKLVLSNTGIVSKTGKPITATVRRKVEKPLMGSLRNKSTIRILEDLSNLPDDVPFRYLQQWRSDLMEIGFAPTDLIPGKTAGMAKYLSKNIDNLFTRAEGGLGGKSLAALRLANTYWKAGKTKFNDKLIKQLVNKDPELIMRTVFKPGSLQPIKKVKNIISKDAWKKLRGAYTSKLLLKDAETPARGISGNKLIAAMRRMGKHTVDEIYTKAEQKELQNLATTLKAIQNRPPGVGGGMLIQLMQAGALLEIGGVIGMSATPFTKTSAVILMGPSALSQLFTRDVGIKWLTKGLVTKKGTKEAIRLASRLSALVGEEYLQKIK